MSDQHPELDLRELPVDKFYIGGKWVEPHESNRIAVVSPDTEEVIAHVAEATDADVDQAVAAAREAFDKGPWPKMAVEERNDWVRKLSAAIVARTEELGLCWTYQIGMPYNVAKMFAPFLTNATVSYTHLTLPTTPYV